MRIAIVSAGAVTPAWHALFERLSRSHGVRTFTCPPASVLNLTGSPERALRRDILSHGHVDVFHGLGGEHAGRLAARIATKLSVPSVVTCDGGEFVSLPAIKYGSQRRWLGRRAVAEACALASRVHVCSEYMSALAHERGVRTAVIPLTSVTSAAALIKWTPSHRKKETARLIQVATLSRLKNQRLLIDALPIVRERVDAHLDLVGEDLLGGELQARAAKIGVGDHVTFHGVQPQDRVHELLSNADLYVQTSLHEAANVAVLEAAAHGVPTVGTLARYVADWSPSKAVAVGDAIPESLADAIVTLLRDDDRRRSMASLARTFAIAHDATYAAAQFDQLYRSLV